ncbi:hypothetical protein ACFVU2_09610 [Leifsonia sp. NPDC058194]|uniref:hypothetical protein n=1 Tax=Leifsonia sp. NPDC058194 TaxID=3346374 RepID=UPI0036DB80E2
MGFWNRVRRILAAVGRFASRLLERVATVLTSVVSGMNGGHGAEPGAKDLYLPPKDEYRP